MIHPTRSRSQTLAGSPSSHQVPSHGTDGGSRRPSRLVWRQEDDILMEAFVHPLLERFSVSKERMGRAVCWKGMARLEGVHRAYSSGTWKVVWKCWMLWFLMRFVDES